MQWLDKPTFALSIGAHAEVIIDPWFLCENIEEMGEQGRDVIEGERAGK